MNNMVAFIYTVFGALVSEYVLVLFNFYLFQLYLSRLVTMRENLFQAGPGQEVSTIVTTNSIQETGHNKKHLKQHFMFRNNSILDLLDYCLLVGRNL